MLADELIKIRLPLNTANEALAASIQDAHVYVLEPSDVQAVCAKTLLKHSEFLDALNCVRAPAPVCFFEFAGQDRTEALEKMGHPAFQYPGTRIPLRVGFFIHSRDGGQPFSITAAWNFPNSEGVSQRAYVATSSAILPEYPLDPNFRSQKIAKAVRESVLFESCGHFLYEVRDSRETEAFYRMEFTITDAASFVVSPMISELIKRGDMQRAKRMMDLGLSGVEDTRREVRFALATLLLLNSG